MDTQSGWQGKLELTYQYRNHSTQVTSAYSQAPLKIQRPFYPEDKSICHSVLLNTSGGVVGGDRLSQKIYLNRGAKSLITTPSANKIYRSEEKRAEQNVSITVEAGGCLEFMPQETIIFNGANYRQNIKVELQENSNFFSWDINRFGRTARGEKYTRGDWQSNTEIWQQGIPLWIERQWLPGNEETFYNLNGLAGQSVIGTLLWVGQPPAPEILVKIRHLWENRATQSEAGVTTLVKGILCRYRGNSTTEVRQWFVDVWHLLRLNYLGRGKIVSRVWQL